MSSSTTTPPAPQPIFQRRHRMRLAMEHAGLNVGDMAEALGKERNAVGAWLSGRHQPSLPDLTVWALKTGVDLEWLVGDEPVGRRRANPFSEQPQRRSGWFDQTAGTTAA